MTFPHYSMVPKDFEANLAFRKSLMLEAANDPLAASQIRTLCKEDMLLYCAVFCWTYNPKAKVKVTPFIPYGFQEEAMASLADCITTGQDAVMYKSRDMGASWMGLIVIEHLWHFHGDLSFLLVSRNEDYVDKRGNPKALFWKLDFLHKHQPKWLLPSGRDHGWKDPNRKLLHLRNEDNESVIDGESTTGDVGRGDRRTAMFIDEHAAFEVNDGYRVLKATRDTTNCRIFNSTPQGAHNGFHDVVKKSSAKKIRLHWSSHPTKNAGLYKVDDRTGKPKLLDKWRGRVTIRGMDGSSRKYDYPENYPFVIERDDVKVRSPWYDNECGRCVSPQEIAQELDIDFLGSDYQFFDAKFITYLIAQYATKYLLRGCLEYDRETLRPRRFVEDHKGNIELWITLADGQPAKDRAFCLGSDISAGTGASNSVTTVGDRATGEKVAVLRDPNMAPKEFSQLTIAMGYWFNEGFLIWDANGPTGVIFTKTVIAACYGNIYYRRNEKKVTRNVSEMPGYFLNPAEREVLFEEYRASLDDHRFINRSERGLLECLEFIRPAQGGGIKHVASANSQDPSGARTAHGDEVVADALCAFGIGERREETLAEEPNLAVGSLAWRRQVRLDEKASVGLDDLGAGW